MKFSSRVIPRISCATALAMAAVASIDAHAQATPIDVDKMVKYAQCIRANGVPDFPDPAPDGSMRFKLDPKTGDKFEAAQRACKDKASSAVASMDQNATPERMKALVAFATCVRAKGVKDFPDPSPNGTFEITSQSIDMTAAQAQGALKACRESNPPGALMIRLPRPR